jgi:hypothetical protein
MQTRWRRTKQWGPPREISRLITRYREVRGARTRSEEFGEDFGNAVDFPTIASVTRTILGPRGEVVDYPRYRFCVSAQLV